jgi:YedE family putative selenium metabolism protein
MGVCVACFFRDISGALGLQRASVVQYIRPEIIGFALGGFITAVAFREWRPRGGSAPILRFFLGICVMVGALVFLGCPTRMLLRLAGGDLGFNLGRARPMSKASGAVIPGLMAVLLILAVLSPAIIFKSETGPGSLHMILIGSLLIGLFIGFMGQRTRFCTVGGWRDAIFVRDFYLLSGLIALLVAALATNYIAGNFAQGGPMASLGFTDVNYHWGFANQPIAHDNHLWNFLGMGLVGLAATLMGGCPFRNTILAGEGDTDAGVTVLGYLAGGALVQNFNIAAGPNGIAQWSVAAVLAGLAFCIILGFTMRRA